MNPYENIEEFKKWKLNITYRLLKPYFTAFHIGEITKKELATAIYLWQCSTNKY